MGSAAIDAARSCGYVGAGTVEFLLDAENNFYFMEMNTRLQVEHAVTEWITGLDLVREQIRIAEGHELPWNQESIHFSGHAIECRIYAEDPQNGFLPGPGLLRRHHAPGGHGVRVDSGVEEGDDVSVHYDPMISKVTSWGMDRTEAILRMDRALNEYEISGVPTTISFCRFVLGSDAFRSGKFSTHFVDKHFNGSSAPNTDPGLEQAMAQTAAIIWNRSSKSPESNQDEARLAPDGRFNNWKRNRMRGPRLSGRQ